MPPLRVAHAGRGGGFLRLANPSASVSETICLGCGKGVPLKQVEWAATGECVAAYRKRLRAATPPGRRLLFRALGPVAGGALGLVLGLISGVLLLLGAAGNPPGRPPIQGLVGGGVGALTGMILGARLLPAPRMRWIGKLDDRGEP